MSFREAATDSNLRRCPTHQHVMWVTSVVRPIRFHDLRHTTGSLLAMLGAEMHTIPKIMRHKDPRVTSETYLHLDPSYLRKEIDRLTFGAPEAVQDEAPVSTPAAAADPRVSIVCLGAGEGGSPRDHDPLETLCGRRSYVGAGYRVRTDDIQLGKQLGRPEEGVAGGGSGLQVGEKIRNDGALRFQGSQPFAPNRSPFVTRLLPESGAAVARLAILAGGKDRLLSVREAAEQLGLCTATVYGLCAEGALPHIRILNAIRIAPADLEAFIEARRVGMARSD